MKRGVFENTVHQIQKPIIKQKIVKIYLQNF
jgi:hypothetical protein